jgi:2-oxoglutarate ferredoxin oxidoreductase subunit alpha
MSRPGSGHRIHVTGLTHTPDGFPTQKPELADRALRRLVDKIEANRDLIDKVEEIETADADILVVAVGIVARAARRAVEILRAEGIKAGLLRPVTLWPFPEAHVRKAAERASLIVVPEMNTGQLVREVERLAGSGKRLLTIQRIDGEPITPDTIAATIREA